MSNYLITGSNGQLGRELVRQFDDQAIARNKEQLDVTNHAQVKEWLGVIKPKAVIHTAAYTDVLNAERPSMKAHSWRINVEATNNLVNACSQLGIPFMYISCDGVFGGDVHRSTPYVEKEATFPSTWYGKTKVGGEHSVLYVGQSTETNWRNGFKYWVVRAGQIFSKPDDISTRSNCAYSLWSEDSGFKRATALADSIRSYVFCSDLAKTIVSMAYELKYVPSGVYHVANGSCSVFDFYAEVVRAAGLRTDIEPVSRAYISERLGLSDTVIPKYSAMSCKKVKELPIDPIPDLSEAVSACFAKKSRKAG